MNGSNRESALVGRFARWLAAAILVAPLLGGAAFGQSAEESSTAAAAHDIAPDEQSPAEPPPAQQPAPEKPAEIDPSKPMGPPDPYNRGTPRGSMAGYLAAARNGDYEQAAEYLDLRRLPPEELMRGPELARRLKAVLDRKLWVDLVNLSDSNAGQSDDALPAWQDRMGVIETNSGDVTLLLQRIPREGDGVRIWKVAASTVERIAPLQAEFEPVWLEEWLPSFVFEREIFEVALWKWIGLALLMLVASFLSLGVAGTTTRLIGAVATRGHESFDLRIVRLVRSPVRLALTVILFAIGRRSFGLPLEISSTFQMLERMVLVVAVAWLVFRLIDLAALAMRVRAEQRESYGLVPVLLPVARFTKLLIVLIGVLGLLGTLGVNVTAAVAGLGVGGIAVALAAQKTLENLFGGVSLFADRPVEVGDFCKYGDQVGTVEEIGLRSTRIRTLDRTLVAIPNAEFSNLKLENYAKRDRIRLWTMIGVRYETTPEQLRFLLTRLRQILAAHPRITADPARVRFVGFGAYSLDLEVFAYSDTSDWNEFLGIREDVYLLFMGAVEDAGTGFAFPSSTMYLGRDTGLNEEHSRRAEERVSEWRRHGQLPFPNLSEELREEANDTGLVWPPPGSPGGRSADDPT